MAGEGTKKFLELKDRSGQAELFKKAGISTAFKAIPLYELDSIEFSSARDKKKLPVTKLMEEAGISQVTSVNDLLTPIAKKCFVEQRLRDMEFEAGITARTAEEMSELSDTLKQQLKRDRDGTTMPIDFILESDQDDHDGQSLVSQESFKKFYRRDV